MTSPKDYEVGYKRPPKETRWKKGQSGNPAHQHPVQPLSALELIDKYLLRLVEVVEKGQTTKVTTLEVIVRQLWQKEIEGNRRALNVRLKYEEIGRQSRDGGLQLRLDETDYMQNVLDGLPAQDAGNE